MSTNVLSVLQRKTRMLRADYFKGTVDQLINYFTYLAEDVRQIMAKLGYKTMEELGRTQ